jgi:hypothetical protein
VRREVLHESSALLGVVVHHDELWDDGNGLQVDGESPEDLHKEGL